MGTDAHEVALETIDRIRSTWSSAPPPNECIDGFDYDKMSALISDSIRLKSLKPSDVPAYAKKYLDAITTPNLSDESLNYAVLCMYWRINEFRSAIAVLANVSDDSNDGSNTHPFYVTIQQYAAELSAIKGSVEAIKSEVTKINTEGAKFGGLSVSALGISVPVKTILRSVKAILSSIGQADTKIDINFILFNLSKVFESAKEIASLIVQNLSDSAANPMESIKKITSKAGDALITAFDIKRRFLKPESFFIKIALADATRDEIRNIYNGLIEKYDNMLVDEGAISESSYYEIDGNFGNYHLDKACARC